MQEDEDYALALQLQAEWVQSSPEGKGMGDKWSTSPSQSAIRSPISIVDNRWELIDPSPDARGLFLEFNEKYFWGKLAGVEVRWSPRMTLCAGVCCYEGRGGLCSVRLSEPLLKLRPRKDLVETLLHEMIHAYLFVTQNNKDREGHGPEFCKHMNRINKETGTNITIYHTFHDEVDNYRQHWWRCDGPCQSRKPYFGYVKRAMNRVPSARDPWWAEHQKTCGGTYHKVKEPEGYGEKKAKKKPESTTSKPPQSSSSSGNKDIRDVFKKVTGSTGVSKGGSSVIQAPKNNIGSSHNVKDNPGTSKDMKNSFNGIARVADSDKTAQNGTTKGTGQAFSCGGQLLGSSSAVHTGPIVRRIPGIGVIRNERPCESASVVPSTSAQTSAEDDERSNSPSIFENLDNQIRNPGGGRKRNYDNIDSSSSGDEQVSVLPKKKVEKKGIKQLKRDLLDESLSPGTSVSIPGFRSVSNRSSSFKKKGSDSLAANRNHRAHKLDSSSSESDTETNENITLGSVMGKKSSQGQLRKTEVERPSVQKSISEAFKQTACDTQKVPCPVCQKLVQKETINAHLDSCLQ